MPLFRLSKKLWFPPVSQSCDDGLLAVGGDLSEERLLLAYRSGIFPWFNEGEPPLWWSPDPRFVLFSEKLRVTQSMKTLIKKEAFRFSINEAFKEVIDACRTIHRPGQGGTWITPAVADAYKKLHLAGYAHSAEAWDGAILVGGLYGIRLGNMFFGESMFSEQSNASKFAFIRYVEFLKKEGVTLIDCQVYTKHLESLGAENMPRHVFMDHVHRAVSLSLGGK